MDENKGQMMLRDPYVAQVDKLAGSLKHLSETFLKYEGTRTQFLDEELEDLYEKVEHQVCKNCEKRRRCMTRQMVYDILDNVEKYGSELSVEMKRKLQQDCSYAPRLLRVTLEAFQNAKQMLMWNNRMVESRAGCAVQLDMFAQMIQHTTREMGASIFMDAPLEKRIRQLFRRNGIRLLSTVFFVNKQGRYEIHVTVKTDKGMCITTKKLSRILSDAVKRKMNPAPEERPVIGQDYCTITFVEAPGYYTLQGIARIGKGCQLISGDSFSMLELPQGQEAAILSDGMGSGERASRESAVVVETLEELLKAGFVKEAALSMLNTALVMGREDVCFSTIDMVCFDLYSGECQFLKAGAATTFIKKKDGVVHISSSSLPLGVVQGQQTDVISHKLESGDMIVLVTDGVLDALPYGRQEELMDLLIQGTNIENPKELSHYLLEKVIELSSDTPHDDMTILVAGIWQV